MVHIQKKMEAKLEKGTKGGHQLEGMRMESKAKKSAEKTERRKANSRFPRKMSVFSID